MLYWGSVTEALAWLEASDDSWADYGALKYAAARDRSSEDEPDGTAP